MLTGGKSAGAATFGLVLLHGRGAGARDIMGLGEALALPDIAFSAPEAEGLSWWPTSFLAPAADMKSFVDRGLDTVDAAVSHMETVGLPRRQIGVLGFSQGGCLALEYLAQRGAGLGFGFALSAGLVGRDDAGTGPDPALYGHDDKQLTYQTVLSGVTLYMSCHQSDPHIPLKRFTDSAQAMQALGADVTSREKPGQGHGVDQPDVTAVRAALNVARA